MRKLILILGLCLLASKVFALGDKYGSERPAIWRSSRTAANEFFVLVATGAIHLHAIVIESPTVNAESYYAVFNSSIVPSATINTNIDTAAFIATQMSPSGSFPETVEYDVELPTGAVVNKSGAAVINLLWEYRTPSEKPGEHDVLRRP